MFSISARGARAALCRSSFYEFLKLVWPIIIAENMVKSWHIVYLCAQLQKMGELVFAGKPKEYDLVVNISPGSSKSTICSQAFQAWCWTRMPSFRSVNASYEYGVALKDSLACRDIVESEFYQDHFPAIQLREDQNAKGLFVNTAKGGRLSASVGSRLTGYHGHMLFVDDPLDPEKAISEAVLKKTNRWMTTTLPSRGIHRADTPMFLIQQRLAQNDPSGERLARGGRVKHICIPAELLWNKEGELSVIVQPPGLVKYYKRDRQGHYLMDPVRLDKRNLLEFEKTLGAYGYAGQYLQDPVPLSGAMFDITKLKLEEVCPRMVRLVRGWDKAATKDAGAYSAGVLFGKDREGDWWVLDVVRGQWTATDRENMIKQTAQLDRVGSHARLVGVKDHLPVDVEIIVEKEGGSGGKESTEATIKRLAGFRVSGKQVTGKKEERAWNFASQVGIQDHVHVLNRPWTHEYIQELRFFPHSKYKDQVDASSLAFNRISKEKIVIGAGALDRK